jgi:hypothetical protein
VEQGCEKEAQGEQDGLVFPCMPAVCTRAQVPVLNAARARQEMRDSTSDGRGVVLEDNSATLAAGPIPGPRARGAVRNKDQFLFLPKKRDAKRQRPPRAEEDAVQDAHAGRCARVHEKEDGDQELATDDGDEPGDAGEGVHEGRGGEQEDRVSDASESESITQSTGGEGEGKYYSAVVLPTSPDVVGDHMLAVSPAKKQVVDGWLPGEKSVLATGVDGELIIVLSPWETIHLVGSVRVLVLAGSCTMFGARLSAAATVASGAGSGIGGAATAGSFHDVHAVPPYGPLGLEAAGRATSSAVWLCVFMAVCVCLCLYLCLRLRLCVWCVRYIHAIFFSGFDMYMYVCMYINIHIYLYIYVYIYKQNICISFNLQEASWNLPGGSRTVPGTFLQGPARSQEASRKLPGGSRTVPRRFQEVPGSFLGVPGSFLGVQGSFQEASWRFLEGPRKFPGRTRKFPGTFLQSPETFQEASWRFH